jgi:hypothetical protein
MWVVLKSASLDAMLETDFEIHGPYTDYEAAREAVGVSFGFGYDCGETPEGYAWIKALNNGV